MFYYCREDHQGDKKSPNPNKVLIDSTHNEQKIFGFKQRYGSEKWTYIGILEVIDYSHTSKHGINGCKFQMHQSTESHPTTPRSEIKISNYHLEQQFVAWKKFIEEKDGRPFISFSTSDFLIDNEYYKKRIWENGVALLDTESWRKNQIGTGIILQNIIQAIEQPDNNLVFTSSHSHTKQGAPHKKLLDLRATRDIETVENLFFNLFNDLTPDYRIFEELVHIVGKKYSILAYIFYLKNPRKYTPIAPRNFDTIFNKKLKVNFLSSRRCSWDNYIQYNSLIQQTAHFLSERVDEIVSLIDAHSFLWTLGSIPSTADNTTQFPEVYHIIIDRSYNPSLPKQQPTFNAVTPEEIQNKHNNNILIGTKGEEIVLEYEKKRQRSVEVPMEKIMIVSNQNSSLGYDITSFDSQGVKIFIEVKTTTRPKNSSFIKFNLTRNEYEKCKNRRNYFIYIVSDINKNPSISVLNDQLVDLESVFKPKVFPGGISQPTNTIVTLKIQKQPPLRSIS